MVSMNEAKKALTVGLQFKVEQTGAVGTIIAERSARGKVQAELTCVKCGKLHVREVSDWHQCDRCRDCKPSKGGKAKVGGSVVTKILDTDTPEIRAMKEEIIALEAAEIQRKAEEAAKSALEKQLEILRARKQELLAKQAA